MGNKTKTLLRLGLLSGILGGILYLLFFSIVYFTQKDPLNSEFKSLEFFLYIVVIVVPLYYYRFKMNGGFLRFWEGLIIGSINAIIFLLLTFLIVLGFIYYVDSDILANYKATMIEQFSVPEVKEDVIKKIGAKDFASMIRDWQNVSAFSVSIREFYKLIIVLPFVVILSALFRK